MDLKQNARDIFRLEAQRVTWFRGYLLKFLQLLQVNMVVFILVMRQMMGAKYMQFL